MEKLLATPFHTLKKNHHPQSIAVDDGFTFIESYPLLERKTTHFPLEEA